MAAINKSANNSKHATTFELLAERSGRYFHALKKPPLPVTILQDVYWKAVWMAVERQISSWCAHSSSIQPQTAGASSVVSERLKIVIISKFLALSVSPSCLSSGGGGGGSNNTLFTAGNSVISRPLSSSSNNQVSSASYVSVDRSGSGGGGGLSVPLLPPVIFEVSKEFQSMHGVTQSLHSVYHTQGIPQRTIELSPRDVLQCMREIYAAYPTASFTAAAALSALTPPTSVPSDLPPAMDLLSVHDVAAIGRMLADVVGTIATQGAARGGSSAAAATTGTTHRLPCHGVGEMLISRGTVGFRPYHADSGSQQRTSLRLGGTNNKLEGSVPPLHNLQKQQSGGGGGLPPLASTNNNHLSSSGGGVGVARRPCTPFEGGGDSTTAASPFTNSLPPRAQTPLLSRADDTQQLPITSPASNHSYDDSRPELRKLSRPASRASSNNSNNIQPSSRKDVKNLQQLPFRPSSQGIHEGESTYEYVGGGVAAHHRPPSSGVGSTTTCSTIGPSASERGGGYVVNSNEEGHHNAIITHIPQSRTHSSLFLHNNKNHHHSVNNVRHLLDATATRSQHRRMQLDAELAEVQRDLETRLGIHRHPGSPNGSTVAASLRRSATSLADRHESSPHTPNVEGRRSSSRLEVSSSHDGRSNHHNGNNHHHRATTTTSALTYYSASPNETRHPATLRREAVMDLAVERHRVGLHQSAMEAARIEAQRSAEADAGVDARIQTELLRRHDAHQLSEQLRLQQEEKRNRQDIRGRIIEDPEPCITRPVDITPFSNPTPVPTTPGGLDGRRSVLVRSVAALGSDPADKINEKHDARDKRRAYHNQLDAQMNLVNAFRAQKRADREAVERDVLDTNAHAMEADRIATVEKRLGHKKNFVEAWDLQRRITASPSAPLLFTSTSATMERSMGHPSSSSTN